VPTFQITRNHPRSRLHYLADAAAPFLGFAKAATELISQPRMFRPVMPAERLVMRTAISGDLLDGALADAGIRRRHRTYAILIVFGPPWFVEVGTESTKITYTLAAAYHFSATPSF
jgi:hypothetical protein